MKKIILITCLLLSALIFSFCKGSDKGAPGIEVNIQEDPLALYFYYDNVLLTSLAVEGRSALYLGDVDFRMDLVGPPIRRDYGKNKVLTYQTSDNRTATIIVSSGKEGAAKVNFSVDGKTESELIGADFSISPDEGFYGLMERVVQGSQKNSWREGISEGLDLRGQKVFLFVYPTVSVYSPFYVSSAGYGVYVESDWPGTYRFGVDDPSLVNVEYEGPDLTLQVFPGPTPLEVVERYARSVGTTILPPRWTFGPWRWRDDVWDLPAFYEGTVYNGPYNSMIVEDILMMEALGIPCTLYWVDRPWALGYFGYNDLTWDEDRLPQPLKMVGWLEDRGIKFMLWLSPWVMGEMADEAVTKGYNVEHEMPTPPFDAKLLDLTNPDAVSWWQDALAGRINEGVVGFKLDRGEEKVPDGKIVTGSYSDGRSFLEGRNAYPALYAAAVHGAFERAGVDEFVVMPRSAWVGTQQHAIIWGGDTSPSEYGLRSAIIALQRSAAMNFPVWGSDTCGYGFAEREVCARWLAFSAFCPLMEVGPTGNIAPWSTVPEGERGGVGGNGYDYTPYYDEELVAIWIFYANLHNDLIEYSFHQARLSHEQGTPIVRPMIFAYPDRPEYKDLFGQYLYGPDLLVAPIWRKGQRTVEVHIPEGDWIDAWSGEEMTPDSLVTMEAPLSKIPIYIRADSGIDLGDLNEKWLQAQQKAAQKPDLSTLAVEIQ